MPSARTVGRRRFFQRVATDVLGTASSLAGVAGAIGAASTEAAEQALASGGDVPTWGSVPEPFVWDGQSLTLLDQRRLPVGREWRRCRTASEVAAALREGVVRGPVAAEVAAYAIALDALAARSARPWVRRIAIRRAHEALESALPGSGPLRGAGARMLARYAAVGELSEDGVAVAEAMRAEAEAVAAGSLEARGRLARGGARLLAGPAATGPAAPPLRVLVHGDTGRLGAPSDGTVLAVLAEMRRAGTAVHAWVTEARPDLSGARLTTWALAGAGVPHTLVTDAAAGYLVGGGEVDVVLVAGDLVTADGATLGAIGTYPIALLAARHAVPLHVCCTLDAVQATSRATPDLPVADGPAGAVLSAGGTRSAPPGTVARNPVFDVTPPDLVTAFITDRGVLRPPFDLSLAAARA